MIYIYVIKILCEKLKLKYNSNTHYHGNIIMI